MNETDAQNGPMMHPDQEGTLRYWVWTHRCPLAIEGRRRSKHRDWHAFATRSVAEEWAQRIDAYAKLGNEVGYGNPPPDVVADGEYESHYEPWE